MKTYFPSALIFVAIVAGIVPPGESAYAGAYIVLAASGLGMLCYFWPERSALLHPTALAIFAALALVTATLPMVYRGETDLLAPVFILPMLATVGLGLLAHPARWMPPPIIFALLCFVAAFIALLGGVVQYFLSDAHRVGLGNNPIHYASLAAMTGGLALTGVASTTSLWRYLFLLGPVFALVAADLSGSRGALVGALAMAVVGTAFLLVWFWRDRLFRFAVLAALLIGTIAISYLIGIGSDRVTRVLRTALNIFHVTGTSDDTRAMMYASAAHVFQQSPLFGVGLGQIMQAAQQLYPEHAPVFRYDNLHSDWANFTVMAGSMGIVAWLLLLVSPLLLLLDRAARADRPVVLGAVLLVTGQTVLGVSNAMFGILPQTTLYAVALGYFLMRSRKLAVTGSTPGNHASGTRLS